MTSSYPWNFSTGMLYAFLILSVPSMYKVMGNNYNVSDYCSVVDLYGAV